MLESFDVPAPALTGSRCRLGAVALALATVLGAAGCGGGSTPSAPAQAPAAAAAAPAAPVVTEAVRKRAKEMFNTVCATCHGTGGKGDGPGAAGLDPKPRAFGDADWQKSVTDEHITKTIVFGGAAVGKSANMPAHPMLKDSVPMQKAMCEIVRSFGEAK